MATTSRAARTRGADPALGRTGLRPDANGSTRERLTALAFIAPALLGFAVFYFWPTLRGLYFSFTEFDVFNAPVWVGLDNYRTVFGDASFWNAMKVTVQYVLINIGTQTVLALLLAVLLHRLTRSILVRSIVVLPYLVSNVVVALVFYWMLDAQIGITNEIIGWFGLDAVPFFGEQSSAIPTIALVNTWRHLGYTALLLFAGMLMIPGDVYEAGRVDGASEWKMFWRITLPLLRPILALVLVITVIGSFQAFDTVAVTTSGGPAEATEVIQYYIFDLAFQRYQFGYASAVSVVLFVILAVVAFVQLRLMRADESDVA
jgi:multiple sugar transport system permease protein